MEFSYYMEVVDGRQKPKYRLEIYKKYKNKINWQPVLKGFEIFLNITMTIFAQKQSTHVNVQIIYIFFYNIILNSYKISYRRIIMRNVNERILYYYYRYCKLLLLLFRISCCGCFNDRRRRRMTHRLSCFSEWINKKYTCVATTIIVNFRHKQKQAKKKSTKNRKNFRFPIIYL